MPWYKFSVRHGPGHQSYSERYDWYPEPLIENLLEELKEDWYYREDFDNPVGKVVLVDKLPENVRQKMIKKYEGQIETAQDILQVLKARTGGRAD